MSFWFDVFYFLVFVLMLVVCFGLFFITELVYLLVEF